METRNNIAVYSLLNKYLNILQYYLYNALMRDETRADFCTKEENKVLRTNKTVLFEL